MKTPKLSKHLWQKNLAYYIGAERAEALWPEIKARHHWLYQSYPPKNRAQKRCISFLLYPPMAIYQVLLEKVSAPYAYALSAAVTHKIVRRYFKPVFTGFSYLPGAEYYGLLLLYPFIRYLYGEKTGQENTFLWHDRDALHFDVNRCPYFDFTAAMGHPELCKVFCICDDINTEGLSPHVHFERPTTLANGDDACAYRIDVCI